MGSDNSVSLLRRRREYGLRAFLGYRSPSEEMFSHWAPRCSSSMPCYSDPVSRALFWQGAHGSSGGRRWYGSSLRGKYGVLGAYCSHNRRGIVRVSYTSRGPRSAAETAGAICYIARKDRTTEKAPDYETAKGDTPLYTYSPDGEKRPMSIDEGLRMIGTGGVIKIILSPESKGADLSEATRRFMEKSLRETFGRRNVKWVAANHWNTDNPHTHIIVSRKVDDDSRELEFPSTWVSGKVRRDYSAILQSMMGERTLLEKRELLRKEIERKKGMGMLDYITRRVAREYGDSSYIVSKTDAVRKEGAAAVCGIEQRLDWLSENSSVVKKEDDGIWILDRFWEERLWRSDFDCLLSSDGLMRATGKERRRKRPSEKEERIVSIGGKSKEELTHGIG